jgi:hypothetical protein
MLVTGQGSVSDSFGGQPFADGEPLQGGLPSTDGFYDNTDSWSNQQGASATLTFYGVRNDTYGGFAVLICLQTSVEYYSMEQATRGPCQIDLDGTAVTTINAYAAGVKIGPVVQLWATAGLPLQEHTLGITVLDSQSPNICEVDKFMFVFIYI